MSNPNIPTIKLEPVNGSGEMKVVASECLGWCYTGQEGERIPSTKRGIAEDYYRNHQEGTAWPSYDEVDLRELSEEEGIAAALAYLARRNLEYGVREVRNAETYFGGQIPQEIEPLVQAVYSGCDYAKGVLAQMTSDSGFGGMNRYFHYLFIQGGRRAGYDYSHIAARELYTLGKGMGASDSVQTAAQLCIGCPHAEQILTALANFAFEKLELPFGRDIRTLTEDEIASFGQKMLDLYEQAQLYLKMVMLVHGIRASQGEATEATNGKGDTENPNQSQRKAKKQIASDKAQTLKRSKNGGKGQKGHD